MTRVLAFDLETSGLLDYKAEADASHQPHIVALAAIIFEGGEQTGEGFSFLVRPEGFTIPESATKISGISQRDAARRGIPARVAVSCLTNLSKTVNVITSFGFESFDAKVVRCALARMKVDCLFPPVGAEGFCSKDAAKALCKIPGEEGSYKAPDLATASLTLLNKPLRGRNVRDRAVLAGELYLAIKAKGL